MTSSLLPTYARAPIAFERGEGAWLTSTTGERFLDFGGGIAVASLGYSHPHLIKALHEQGDKLWHTSNLFQIPQAERLAERLTAVSFADFVFFTNSGAEAMEGVIKTARKYHAACGHPEKNRIITFQGAFHGRTLATIAAAGNEKYLDGFEPRLPGFDNVPFGDLEAVKAAIKPETGAILIEPIQGEGGIRVVSPDFLQALRKLCDEQGLLLLLDEVQSGVGRSGKLFAYEWAGVEPDVMAIAKGIGGGFPLGAFMATREAAKGMVVGTHGSTYGGNPLATSIGNAVLDIVLEPSFLAHVEATGVLLQQRLVALRERHPEVIAELRGAGLMRGIKVTLPVADFAAAARAEKLLVIPAGDNVVRLLPPLIIGEEEVDGAIERLDAACAALKARINANSSSLLSGAAE
ncbi:aspartate aminotransferase family protein [Beijerinckia indica]|uniref:Acetylornithine aminotransferase n=1 Tax=Beijerinckia indica subsp. indica (strain ATCC 9039 / DSM 1715 / NCIMB 8712) TaxID=395963 RepID=B2IBT6_BEII9|nr:aspartate aminotransferase family protein [Beijerinckia indica]ACB93808.1 acetylornithine and succinylornithine aminotransferase [Beijerinckia indica subsp. indica ATCC 9039]